MYVPIVHARRANEITVNRFRVMVRVSGRSGASATRVTIDVVDLLRIERR